MQLHEASLDLKQAFDRVTPQLLYDAMVDSTTHRTQATALLREQVRGRNMVSFQGITVNEVGFDKSTKQGGGRGDLPCSKW